MSTDQTPPTTDAERDSELQAEGSIGSKIRGALIAIALLPVLVALVVSAQGDFDPFGTWINPVVLAVTAVGVIIVWAATGKSQR
jgi:hypothetical protein